MIVANEGESGRAHVLRGYAEGDISKSAYRVIGA